MKKSTYFFSVLLLVFFMSGCQTYNPSDSGGAQSTESNVPVKTPFLTNTIEPTRTLVVTDTPAPTFTEMPPTETIAPTSTPSPLPAPTQKLELRIYIYNYCDIPVNIKITGPLSFTLLFEPGQKSFVDTPVGTYTFWNDKNKETTEYQITGATFPYCVCTKYCHVD